MRSTILYCLAALGAGLLALGCERSAWKPLGEAAQSTDRAHGHARTTRRGAIASLGDDEYHVEALVTADGELRLYTLGHDTTEIVPAPAQKVAAYAHAAGGSGYVPVELEPRRQPGDGENKASLFVGRLSPELAGKELRVTVPNFAIAGKRFRLAFIVPGEKHNGSDHDPESASSHEALASGSPGHAAVGANVAVGGAPKKVSSDAERTLYLTPAGLYTWADIDANGNLTGSQKFADFEPAHDLDPKPGDKICPITLTKANPNCAWIVGGQNYEFCCPPCVDEFIKLAKNKPAEVKQPDDYTQPQPSDTAQ